MNDFVIAIFIIIGVPTALVIVKLLWYWMTGQLGNTQEQDAIASPDSKRDTFAAPSTDAINKEHYSKDTEKVVKQNNKELSDSTIICLHKSYGGMRVFCCDYRTMPSDAIEQLLESDSYTEGYACVKGNQSYEQIKMDFNVYCNNIGLNNHYEGPGAYIDYTKHQDPTQCVSCDVFPWVICEWKGDTSAIPRPRDYSSVKLSEAQKRFCVSFDRDADRNADYWNKQGLR